MIKLERGDITKTNVDVIVNAANQTLLGGGGVDGAIHQAAGPELVKECSKIGGCKTGDVVMTSTYNLPHQKIIHTVGPIWNGGLHQEIQLLMSCYRNSLTLLIHTDFKTIAFPNISTGVYGFPKELASIIAISEVNDFLKTHKNIEVTFVCFDEENYNIYNMNLNHLKTKSI